jgi:hypothetical protein
MICSDTERDRIIHCFRVFMDRLSVQFSKNMENNDYNLMLVVLDDQMELTKIFQDFYSYKDIDELYNALVEQDTYVRDMLYDIFFLIEKMREE